MILYSPFLLLPSENITIVLLTLKIRLNDEAKKKSEEKNKRMREKHSFLIHLTTLQIPQTFFYHLEIWIKSKWEKENTERI